MNDTMGKIALLGMMCLAMGIVMYLLYINGWMILNSKSAVTFFGSKGGKSASFSGCSGSVRRIVRFPGDGVYSFVLDCALTRGDMTVSLLGPDKKELLCLSSSDPERAVCIEKKKRYTLVISFRSATGRYDLHWDRAADVI